MSEPGTIEVEYRTNRASARVSLPLAEGSSTYECSAFSLAIARNGARTRIELTPKTALEVTRVQLSIRRDFKAFSRVLFNGYQSWTDTHEAAPNARQRGLIGAPAPLVDKFAIDGSGDYRFYRYTARPGYLHGWTYVYFASLSSVWMAASLDEARGFTLFDWRGEDELFIVPEAPARALEAELPYLLADVAIIEKCVHDGAYEAAVDAAFAQWFSLMDERFTCKGRHARPLTGYSSWYRHYAAISAEKLERDLAATKRVFDALDTRGFTRVFQIDDGYAPVGDWTRIDKCKFPQGMHIVCEQIKEAGFTPGLWVAPFVCEKDSWLFANRPEWLLRDEDGSPVRTGCHWSGGYALDVLNPDARTYIIDCLRTATVEWGFELLKLDFLYAACMLPHGGMNRGQLMRNAIELVRFAVGDDVIIDGCGVPLASVFGLADFCRIGCDVGLDWDGSVPMRATERERVSTKNSLGNTVYRAPLNRRAFGCDPDVVLLREDVAYTPEQREMVLFGAATHASMLLTSDDPSTWTETQRTLFQEALDIMCAACETGAR